MSSPSISARGSASIGRRLRRRRSIRTWAGFLFVTIVLFCALLGPAFAPYGPNETEGLSYASPSRSHILGLDYLGRDVLSRFLWGGRTALILAILVTALAYAIGLPLGLISAYRGGIVDGALMRTAELFLAFPSIILVLLLVTAFGSSLTLLVLAAGITSSPRTARIVRAAALPIVGLSYVEAARARGERSAFILCREVLPNIRAPLYVDLGIRFTYSILIVAAVSFLGLGLKPPAADWGLMVSENRGGITIQPWAVVAPIVALGLLTVGINLVIDGRSNGHPSER